jgi:arylformamidase
MTGNGRWSFDLVDLTRPLTEETIVALLGDSIAGDEYERYRTVSVERELSYEASNSIVCRFSLADHVGTHVDAPSHCLPGGANIEDVPLTNLIGEAVVLDMQVEGDHGYTAADFEHASPGVERGDIVLIRSGFRDCGPEDRVRQSYLTVEAAEWLVDRGVRAVGVEPGGAEHCWDGVFVHRWDDPDCPDPAPWPVHRVLLGAGISIVEGLTNLDGLAGERVRFAGLPLPIPGLTGSPIRAVAWRDR